jgi:hypothetical protein
MKCEICTTIERLGLDESAHDLWHCADAGLMKTATRESRSYLREIGRRVQSFARSHSRYYRMMAMAYHRSALVTLEL